MYMNGDTSTEDVAAAFKESSEAFKIEKVFWKQIIRLITQRKGDMNSTFFHVLTK